MVVEESIVLGNFPTFASSLQKDFNSILEKGVINNVLAQLLTAVDDIAFTSNYNSEDFLDTEEPPKKYQNTILHTLAT